MSTKRSPSNSFTRWLSAHHLPWANIDPEGPLDDLEPLRWVVGDARVVAIGESSHFIEEFALVRQRILRFLVERCGFGVLAFEAGFAEGFALDDYARMSGPADALDRYGREAMPLGVDRPLRWLRRYNRTAPRPVRFAGVDVPEAGGSLEPALAPVAEFLTGVDPDLLPLVESAREVAQRFGGRSMAVASPGWGRLDPADQDALSALLLRLLIRFRSVEPLYVSRSDQDRYDRALRCVEAACHTDYHFRAMNDLYSGGGISADASAREVFMAESVLWHLERTDPGVGVVLAAHNAHIQKVPAAFDGHVTALPMGQHLHRALGDDYLAIGLTSTGGRTAEMQVDETARFGFLIDEVDLEPPEERGIEAAFAEAGVELGLVDLQQAPRQDSPDRIRMQGSYIHLPVVDAFDCVINIPSSTVGAAADQIGRTRGGGPV